MVNEPMFVGCTDDGRYEVVAYLRDGCLFLEKRIVGSQEDDDRPITLVTREGLLRLSQGPFEQGLIEDHL